MKIIGDLPGVVTWRLSEKHSFDPFFNTHSCFARKNSLPLYNITGSSSSSSLRHIADILHFRSILLVDTTTIISPFYSEPTRFSALYSTYLNNYDVIIPVTQPPSPLIIGTYSLFLKNSQNGRDFLDSWIDTSSALCSSNGSRRRYEKPILYAAILTHVAKQLSLNVSAIAALSNLDSLCPLEKSDLHRAFTSKISYLLKEDGGSQRTYHTPSTSAIKGLLLKSGILLAHDPFTFNAAVFQKFDSSGTEQWIDRASESLCIHAGGLPSGGGQIDSHLDSLSNFKGNARYVYLMQLMALLGLVVGEDACITQGHALPHRKSFKKETTSTQAEIGEEYDADSWHLLAKICMTVMLLCLLVSVCMMGVVVLKHLS